MFSNPFQGHDNPRNIPDAELDGAHPNFIQTVYKDADAFRAATALKCESTAQDYLTNLTIGDDHAEKPSKGLWARLSESVSNAITSAAYAEAGMLPPESTMPTAEGNSARSTEGATASAPADKGTTSRTPDLPSGPGGTCSIGERGGLTPGASNHDPLRPDNQNLNLGNHAEAGKKPVSDGDARENAPTSSRDKTPNPFQKGIDDYLYKRPQDLEPGANPRLGCVLMVSHAMHAVDKTFPETNNTAEFRKALKEHGYEEIHANLKPGDPALQKPAPGDILIGSRPDGMPSHVAISMGDGTVFNNNSDAGRAQIDSINQFNQGMHDSKGHWNKDGYQSVTIYRKRETATPAT